MHRMLQTVLFGGFLAGSLAMFSMPVMAHDYWHWSEADHRWEHGAKWRSDKRDLAQARQQAQYDASHHASRKKIAEDDARIQDILNDMHHGHR